MFNCTHVRANCYPSKNQKKSATWIMHKIRTLFLPWDTEKSCLTALRCNDARSRATGLANLVIKWRDKNSVLIWCIIQVAIFFGQCSIDVWSRFDGQKEQDELMIKRDFRKRKAWTIFARFKLKIPNQTQAGLTRLGYISFFSSFWGQMV